MVVISKDSEGEQLQILATADYPSDGIEVVRVPADPKAHLEYASTSTDSNHLLVISSEKLKIVPTTAAGIEAFVKDTEMTTHIAHVKGLHIDVRPALEFQQ